MTLTTNPRTLNTCRKCGWQWFQHNGKISLVCPKCHTHRWNRDALPRGPQRGSIPKGENFGRVLELHQESPCLIPKDIATKLGISRERVRQILAKQNLPTHKTCKNCGKIVCTRGPESLCFRCKRYFNKPRYSLLVPLICNTCGELFYRLQRDVINRANNPRYKDRVFCSVDCFHKRGRKS